MKMLPTSIFSLALSARLEQKQIPHNLRNFTSFPGKVKVYF